MPRFSQGNLEHNLALVDRLAAVSDGGSVSQIAIAWVLSRGDDIVPLVGARTREQLRDALGALEVSLTADELAQLERAVPPEAVAGERYGREQMAALDSER